MPGTGVAGLQETVVCASRVASNDICSVKQVQYQIHGPRQTSLHKLYTDLHCKWITNTTDLTVKQREWRAPACGAVCWDSPLRRIGIPLRILLLRYVLHDDVIKSLSIEPTVWRQFPKVFACIVRRAGTTEGAQRLEHSPTLLVWQSV